MSGRPFRIGVVAPASRMSPEVADRVRALAASLYPSGGPEFVFHPHALERSGHFAGDDESADEATVKRFFRENGRVRLQPENDALEPIYAQHVQILGRVTGVFRSL